MQADTIKDMFIELSENPIIDVEYRTRNETKLEVSLYYENVSYCTVVDYQIGRYKEIPGLLKAENASKAKVVIYLSHEYIRANINISLPSYIKEKTTSFDVWEGIPDNIPPYGFILYIRSKKFFGYTTSDSVRVRDEVKRLHSVVKGTTTIYDDSYRDVYYIHFSDYKILRKFILINGNCLFHNNDITYYLFCPSKCIDIS